MKPLELNFATRMAAQRAAVDSLCARRGLPKAVLDDLHTSKQTYEMTL